MKNFLSQTWVASAGVIVLVVIAAVVLYKQKHGTISDYTKSKK